MLKRVQVQLNVGQLGHAPQDVIKVAIIARMAVRASALALVMTAAGLGVSNCAALEGLRALVQAPKFEEAEGQPAEIRLLPPGAAGSLGGAGVRLWTKVTNPNLSISFADLPGLANVVRRAVNNEALEYRLDGTIGVDAGRLGTPRFGPMTIVRGYLRKR